MGDANISPGEEPNIETLRTLALLSMPKRQGRNLMLSNPTLKSEGLMVFPSPATKPEDKEEGELSSDDDAEGATATFASVEPALNQDSAQKSLIPLRGSSKEMLAPGTNFTGYDSHEGVSPAAEAFLASLRIPVPKDDFVIKFDDDSDSDGEHQNSLSSSSAQLGNNPEKSAPGSVGLSTSTPLSQATSAGPNQKPAGLKSEIDRMKKQIAAMERSKGKPPVLPVVGKSLRVISLDSVRSSVPTATDAKSVVQAGSGNFRSGPDLESLRLQIAAKESELQQRRQRLAARGPEASKIVSDLKGMGVGVPMTSQEVLSRTSSSYLAVPSAASAGNSGLEKMLAVAPRKEVLNQADGLIALATTGPAGVLLTGHKKDVRLSGEDSCPDHQNVTDDAPKQPTLRAGSLRNNVLGRQFSGKGTKRSHAGVESLESTKVARVEGGLPLADNLSGLKISRGPGLAEILPVTVNGTCKSLPVQGSSQNKRKVDATEMPCKAAVEIPGPSTSGGSDVSKKLKKLSEAVPGEELARGEGLPNPKHLGPLETSQASTPFSSAAPVQTPTPSERSNAAIMSLPTQAVRSATVADTTLRNVLSEGEGVLRVQKPVMVTEDLPVKGIRGAMTAGHVQNTEVPISLQGLARIPVNEGEHIPKMQKPRFQYEGSHALAALAGVPVPDAGVTEAVARTEPSVKRNDFVSSHQQVREGMEIRTGLSPRPSSVLLTPETHMEHQAQSLGFDYSDADNWDVDPDLESFEQFQAQEEVLIKKLEEAQERRHRCELRERVARKEFRESQRALREVNAECDLLNQRLDVFLSRFHLVESRKYTRKQSSSRDPWLISAVDNSSLRLTGSEVVRPCSLEDPPTSVVQCAVPLPPHQPSRELEPCDANGEKSLAIQDAQIRGTPSVKYSRGPTVVQRSRKDSVTLVAEDDEPIIRVAPSDGNSKEAVVHGHGGDVVIRRDLKDITYVGKVTSPACVPETESGDLRLSGATEAVAIPSCNPNSESKKIAVAISEGGTPGNLAPKDQHVTVSSGNKTAAGFDIRFERTMIEGKQLQAKSNASLSLSELSKEQGNDTLATACGMTTVSNRKLSSPKKSHEYVQNSKAGNDTAPGGQDEQGVPGSSASSVEILVEEITNHAGDSCIVAGKVKPGFPPSASRADEDHDREMKSPTLEALEVESSVEQSVLRALSRSSHDLAQSTSKEKAFDVSVFQGRDNCDGPEGKGAHLSMVDGEQDEISKSRKLLTVDEDRPLDHSLKAGSCGKEDSANFEDLPMDYQRLFSQATLMNGVRVEEPDFETVVKVPGEVTTGGCLLTKHQQLTLSRAVSEEIKISPSASISVSSRQMLSETRRGSCADSEDLSTCTDHVRPQDPSKTMSSNKSADDEAMCRSTRYAGGFGDLDTMELEEEIHSSDKLEISKKGNLVHLMEKFESDSAIGNLSSSSQPGSGPALERRQKSLVGEIGSMQRQNLPFETVLETKEQYSHCLRSAGGDKVVIANDLCTLEFEESNVSLDHGPTENSCPPQTGPGQEQSVLAPFDANRQRLTEDSPVEEDDVRRGVDKVFCPTVKDDEDPGKRSTAFQGMEDVHITVVDYNRGKEGESADVVVPDREAENCQQDPQSVDARESRHSTSQMEIDNSKGVEVEVFKKALLEGNVYKTSSRGEEAVATIGIQTPMRDADKEQIIPPLQTHLLDQLLHMVGLRTQGAAVQEEGQSAKGPLTALLGDNGIVGAQSSHVECPEPVAQSAEQAQVPCGEKAEGLHHCAGRGALSDSSGGEHWVPSAAALVSLRCIPRIVHDTSDTPVFDTISISEEKDVSSAVRGPAVLPRYESPLSVFRSYRSFPQFAGAMRLSSSSSTWSHAINPHKPLCRFEHRGQCRNDHCPWQHADDYTLSSSKIVVELPNRGPPKLPSKVSLAVNMECTPPSTWPKIGSSPVPGVDSSDNLQKFGNSLLAPNVSSSQDSSPRKRHDYEISVPTYRIGYYTLKAEDPTRRRVGISGIQRKWRTEIYNSFLLSPSIHRTLPSDSPCLLDTSKSKLSTIDASDAAELPNWRYTGKIHEERVFNQSVSLHGAKDVEMWLELALNHIDFDIASEKPKARDEALCILSRGLETKQDSVTLWMAYSCLFHTRRDSPESDDMFQFAIQYIPGSYELWLLYINSRPDLASRMEAYEKAVVALVEHGTQVELLREDSSACLLDIALQMLYCMCVSDRIQDALSWIDDLLHDASTTDLKEFHRGSTSALLSHLTPHDACILWISCIYLCACGQIPGVITRRLGCKHELPCNLDWDTRARSDKVHYSRVMKALSTATSSGRGCLSLEDPVIPMSLKINYNKEVLGVNYVQCIAFYEGLESAAGTSQHLVDLYPTSVELILLYARIQERRAGSDAGLKVFEEGVSNWPADQPGIQRLWNQYAVYGLLWGGNNLVHRILCKSLPSKVQQPGFRSEDQPSRTETSEASVPAVRPDQSTLTSLENASSDMWSELRAHYLLLTRPYERRSEEGTSLQSGHDDGSVYALINLALVEALSGNRALSQHAIMRAMKIAVLERDSRQCWKELASLQILGADVEHNMLRLLDRCKTETYILSQLKPLSLKVLDDLKRPHVRKFFVDLLGPLPTDHSLLNCILEICYGPSLLPSEYLTMKDCFHFAEGILEAMPGNVELALSLCKLVFQEGGSPKSKHLSSAIWASALLISSLQHSYPVAPEAYWVEAGLLLSHLRKEKSLEEYYVHALVKYPFSAALRQGLEEVRLQILESNVANGGLQLADMDREVTGPIEV